MRLLEKLVLCVAIVPCLFIPAGMLLAADGPMSITGEEGRQVSEQTALLEQNEPAIPPLGLLAPIPLHQLQEDALRSNLLALIQAHSAELWRRSPVGVALPQPQQRLVYRVPHLLQRLKGVRPSMLDVVSGSVAVPDGGKATPEALYKVVFSEQMLNRDNHLELLAVTTVPLDNGFRLLFLYAPKGVVPQFTRKCTGNPFIDLCHR